MHPLPGEVPRSALDLGDQRAAVPVQEEQGEEGKARAGEVAAEVAGRRDDGARPGAGLGEQPFP